MSFVDLCGRPGVHVRTRTRIGVLALGQLLAACSTRVRPQDMSVENHLAAAGSADQSSLEHREAYDPTAPPEPGTTDPDACAAANSLYRPCWTDAVNPTARHLARAGSHRSAAKAHRKAAEALIQAEAMACAGLSPDDRDMSPFFHTADFRVVETTESSLVVVFRQVPGLTRSGLAKLVECHLARNASLGHDLPEMDYCPLVPRGISATVMEVADGFEVALQASGPEASADLGIRARRLKKRASTQRADPAQ